MTIPNVRPLWSRHYHSSQSIIPTTELQISKNLKIGQSNISEMLSGQMAAGTGVGEYVSPMLACLHWKVSQALAKHMRTARTSKRAVTSFYQSREVMEDGARAIRYAIKLR